MKNAWKALASVSVAAALVIAPLVTAGAMAEALSTEESTTEIVPETTPEATSTETTPETTPEASSTEVTAEAAIEAASTETTPEAAQADTVTMHPCTPSATFPTSTNLAPQGWSFKPNHTGATYVDGGLSLDATIPGGGSSWAKVTLPAGTHLSEIGDLTTTFVSKSSAGWGGIILEGGELAQQLHYDDNGRFWTTQAGIFAADRAGYYQSFPIVNGADVPTSTPELLTDPIIGTLRIYINEGQKVIVGSQNYACGTQAFKHEALTMHACTSSATLPTSTNLAPQGWSFKPNHTGATYVDGGLSLDATVTTDPASSWVIKTLPAGTHLSQIGDLTTTFVSKSSASWGGIILEGGELTAQLHYDDNGRFWTTQAGIFAADRAGYYQSFPIVNGADVPTSTPELLTDPIIGTIKIYVNAGQKVIVGSQSYLCGTQAFNHKNPIVMHSCTSSATLPTSTNLAPQGWSFKPNHTGATYVDGGLSLDATVTTDPASSWVIKTLPAGTHLSQIGDLTTTFVSKSSASWGGIILEGGELTAQLHYDDNGRFWTTQAGIFAADRAGYYQSFPIVNGADVPTSTPELLTDPIIGTIKIYVNAGQKVIVGSQSYACGTQAFDKATASATDPGTADPGATDPGTTGPGTTEPGTTEPATAGTTTTGSLASTGGPNMAPWWIGAAALMLAGAALIGLRKVARN